MIQGFFFNGVDTKATGSTVAVKYYLVLLASSNITQATLALSQAAVARTQITLYSAVIQPVPVLGRMGNGGRAMHGIHPLKND